MQAEIQIRKAVAADIPKLRALIDASVRGLQAGDYSPQQIEGALKTVFGVDSQLIADETYFIAEAKVKMKSESADVIAVGCGGWSKRKTLYGGDQWTERKDSLLIPAPRPRKSAPSSSTRTGRAAESAAPFWKRAKRTLNP